MKEYVGIYNIYIKTEKAQEQDLGADDTVTDGSVVVDHASYPIRTWYRTGTDRIHKQGGDLLPYII